MIDVQLSREIEVGAKAKPRYSTDIIPADGGFEFRNENWAYPKWQFEFSVEPGNQDDPSFEDPNAQTLAEFIDIFHVVGGSAETFKFRNWRDYQAVNQLIGHGDGATTTFQLYRVYSSGAYSRQRKITRPDPYTIHAYVAGVEQPVTLGSLGKITFASPPGNGVAITASFEFWIPVRFDNDELELVSLSDDLDQPVNIILVEDLEEDVA